jgi:RimJ/RimL family protein N-acetyltransferase
VELRPAYPVSTARLRLRPLTRADAPALLAYRGDAKVCRYLPFPPMDAQALARRLAADLGRQEITAEGQALTLGAERSADGRLVGDVVLFFHSAAHRGGEIGYVFHPDAAGHGYAREACTAVLDLAFGRLGLHRVTARMDSRNRASARLAAALGLRHEAHHRSSEMFKGAWADLDIYAILDDEWRSARAAGRPAPPSGAARRIQPS